MTHTYYQLSYRLDGMHAYLIWFSNDQDGISIEPDGTVPSFPDHAGLLTYASAHQLTIDPTPSVLHDLDAIISWLRRPLLADIDCDSVLNIWNLFGDLATSVGQSFNSDRKCSRRIYEKLFWGNNLPAVTPPGKHYRPIWSDEERLILQEILSEGLMLFRRQVKFR